MAEAKGIISLEVKGQSKLDRLISSVNQLDSIVQGLSKSPLEIDVKKAKSELDRLETDLKALRQNIQNSEKQIDRAGNSINEYAGEIVALQSRLKELNPNTVAYNKVLERQQKAINNLAQAQGNLAKAEQELESSQSKIGATTRSVETAKAAKRASEAINNLADDYLRLGRSQEKGISGVILKNQLNPTIAQLSAQADVLKLVASNSRIASSEFNRFTIASQAAGQKIFEANQKQLSAAAFGLSASAPAVNVGRAGVSSIAGARSQVASLIKLYPEIVKSEAALSSYAEQLRTLQSLVPYTSNEFRALEEAIAGVSQEISGIGSRGQTSAIRSALGPSTDLGSLKAFQQREKHEERVTAELIRQAGIEDRINRGNINQNQALELRNRLDEAASALAEGRLVTARRIAIETDKQRMSMERNLGGVSVIGALGTGFSPITGRMPSGEIIPGSPADKGRQAKARLGWQSALAQMSVVASELKNTAKTKGAKIQMDWNLAFEKAKDIISDATLAGLQEGTRAAVSLGQQQIGEMERSTAKLWREFGGPALPPRMASGKMPTGGVLRSSELSPIDAPRRLRGALASGAILEQSLVNLQGKGADVTSQLISLQNTLNDAKREDYLISQKNLDALAEQISLTGKFITLQNKVLSGQSKQSKQSSFGVALSPQQIQQEIGKIVTDFNRVVPSAEKTGNNLVSTFSSSLKGGASSAAVAAKSFADVIKQAIEKAFGIASPSKFIQELVENLVSTFIVEIASAAPSVANAFNNTFGQRNLGPGYGDIGPGLPARSRAFGVGLAPSVFRRFGGQTQSSAAFSPIFQPGSTPPIGAPGSGFPYFPAYNLSTTKFPSSGPANIFAKGNRSTDTSKVVLESIKQYRAAVNNFWEGEDSQFEAITRVLTSSARLGAARLARRLQQGPDLTQAERIVQEARGIAAGQKSGTLSRISDVITGEKRLGISSAIGNVSQRISDSLLDSLEILGFTITDGLRDAIDKVRNAVPSVLGGIAGILPPGGFGGGGRGGAAGAGGPQNVNDLQRALGLGDLAPIARATGEQIEELAARLNELRQRIDPTTQDFRELTQQLGILSRETERRSPEAGFLTRRVGPRAARGISEGVIGGAFPLLFGQGLGASIGGGVGGFAGGFAGGGLGFGLSLIGTALGTALDALSQAAQDTGKALKYPTESFEKLKEAGLFASRQQEYYISKLIESGRIQQAQVEIQTEIIKKIGVSGVNDLTDLGDSSTRLSKAWADFNLQLQVALAGPMAGLLDWIASVVRLSTATIQQQAMNLDPAAFEQARGRAASSASRFGIVGNKSKYESELNRLSQEIVDKNLPKLLPKSSTLTPEEQETVFQKSRQVADEIKSAYREGFQLQQQSIDLQRQGAELQRRIAEDIFNKQQQIQRRQIEADQLRKQIAIETADLEYRRRIANEEGRVAEVLAAEAEVMRTKAEGEAQIESKKRMLELDIAKQKRETENYIYQLNKEIDGIRRATLNYEMEVADYRLKIQRQIEDEARIAEAKRKAGGAKPASFGGGAFTSRKRDPDAEKTGWDIVMPGGRGAGVRSPIDLTITGTGFQGKGAGSTGKGYGNWITGEFKLGGKTYELLLGHFDKINVAKGAKIPAGGMLGAQGITGRTFGAHVTTHVNPLKGASVGDAWNALNTITKAWESGEAINPLVSQYQSASSGIKRPNVPMVSPGAVGGQMTTLNARDEAIQRQSLNLEQQLTKLREQGALQRLYEVAQGEKDIAQRRQALSLAKAEFSVIGAVFQDRQESLLFEAQALEKIITRKAEDEKILQNTKLQGQERQKLIDQLAIGLSNTQKQIELDRELLALAQQRRFEEEKTGLQRQIQTTGAGLGAGFVGGAAQAYESELMRSGSAIKAREIAELTNQLTLAQVQAEGMQQSVLAVGDAFGTAMTTGVAELVKGTTTAQEVFAQFLNAVANALLQAAAQMIATYVAIGIARMFAGFGGKGGDGGNAATALGSNPNVAKYAPLANGGVFDGGFTAFAKGGMFTNSIVSSPTLFRFADGAGFSAGLMGEAGPEAIMPLTRGPGGRLGVDASGSGESINVTVNVDASGSKVQGDDQSANQLGRVVANAVQQELIKQKRPGGLLS